MKSDKRTLFLGVALVVVAGLFTANVSGLMSVKAVPVEKTMGAAGAYMTGHVTTILTDSQGVIKEYRQTDNIIVDNGENCVLKSLFQAGAGSGTGTTVCIGALNNPFDVIAVGTGTTKANGTDVTLGNELTGSGFASGVATTKTWTNSTLGTPNGSAKIVLAKTFTNSGTTVQVAESGLFNDTNVNANTNGLFARQNFTAITVGNGDSLTVQWTINVGGTQFNLAQ